jgi:hypothetical protein
MPAQPVIAQKHPAAPEIMALQQSSWRGRPPTVQLGKPSATARYAAEADLARNTLFDRSRPSPLYGCKICEFSVNSPVYSRIKNKFE